MGAEITKKMELGLFTKGICSSILQVVRAVNPYLHHAFGDKKDYELPHIVGPMWSLFDRLEITPPGGQVPELGGLMDEEAGHRTKRRKTPNFFVDANTSDTYSMSFKTSSLELVDWTIVKVPVMGEMDLHTYVLLALPLNMFSICLTLVTSQLRSNSLHDQTVLSLLLSLLSALQTVNCPSISINSSYLILSGLIWSVQVLGRC